jgi:hypothetical protein
MKPEAAVPDRPPCRCPPAGGRARLIPSWWATRPTTSWGSPWLGPTTSWPLVILSAALMALPPSAHRVCRRRQELAVAVPGRACRLPRAACGARAGLRVRRDERQPDGHHRQEGMGNPQRPPDLRLRRQPNRPPTSLSRPPSKGSSAARTAAEPSPRPTRQCSCSSAGPKTAPSSGFRRRVTCTSALTWLLPGSSEVHCLAPQRLCMPPPAATSSPPPKGGSSSQSTAVGPSVSPAEQVATFVVRLGADGRPEGGSNVRSRTCRPCHLIPALLPGGARRSRPVQVTRSYWARIFGGSSICPLPAVRDRYAGGECPVACRSRRRVV